MPLEETSKLELAYKFSDSTDDTVIITDLLPEIYRTKDFLLDDYQALCVKIQSCLTPVPKNHPDKVFFAKGDLVAYTEQERQLCVYREIFRLEQIPCPLVLTGIKDTQGKINHDRTREIFAMLISRIENLPPARFFVEVLSQGHSVDEVEKVLRRYDEYIKSPETSDFAAFENFQPKSWRGKKKTAKESKAYLARLNQWLRSVPLDNADYDDPDEIFLDAVQLGFVDQKSKTYNFKRIESIRDFVESHWNEEPNYNKLLKHLRKSDIQKQSPVKDPGTMLDKKRKKTQRKNAKSARKRNRKK